MNTFKQNIIMPSGTSSYKNISIPSGLKFLSVINNSNNKIEVYQEQRTTSEVRSILITTPAYTQQTIPIGEGREFTFIFTDGGGTDDKKAELIFSDINLGIQGILGTIISGTVTVGSDSVGLARQAQLPVALTGSGNLKTAVTESLPAGTNNIGDVDIVTMPNVTLNALPSGTNNIGDVDVLTLPAISLAASTNNIGDVDVLTLPNITRAGKSSVKVTASGDTTVKASAGVFYDIIVLTAGVTATVKDNATEKWAVSDTIHHTPSTPITCGTSIVVTLSGAGAAYIIYE